MNENLEAKANVTIHAPIAKVWDALVNPEVIKRYMFGATVVTDWKEGSPIAWKGEWKGKPYEDKGRIVVLRPEERLQYRHFSPLTGAPDKPENYHTVTIELAEQVAACGGPVAGQQQDRAGARRVAEELVGDARRAEEGRRELSTRPAALLVVLDSRQPVVEVEARVAGQVAPEADAVHDLQTYLVAVPGVVAFEDARVSQGRRGRRCPRCAAAAGAGRAAA